MSADLISDHRFTELSAVILNPTKSFYSPYPEFSPLEFEHFCVKLLSILEYEILSSNDTIAPDGGVDFVARKDNRIIIGQCKKSDWSGKIAGGNPSNISEPTVMQHFGLVNMKAIDYPDNEVIGYVMTLRKFSLPCRTSFENNPKIKLIGLTELRILITDALLRIDSANKQITLRPETSTNPWYDVQIEQINTEISMLESIVADAEIEYSQASVRSSQAEKIIMNELIDLYRELELLKSEINFIKEKNAKKATEEDKEKDEELNNEYAAQQSKINEEYDDLEEEYIQPIQPPLNDADEAEAKLLYRELSHRFHPDKHQESHAQFTKIFQAINHAKTNLTLLKDIQLNPHKYFDGDIPQSVDVSKEQLVKYLNELQKRYSDIQTRIETILEGTNAKLYAMYYDDRTTFDELVSSKRAKLQTELDSLRTELEELLETNVELDS